MSEDGGDLFLCQHVARTSTSTTTSAIHLRLDPTEPTRLRDARPDLVHAEPRLVGGGGDDGREARRRGGEEVGADAGEGGREVAARIIDISLSGAALSCEVELPLDCSMILGRTPARVVRQFKGGVAVEFRLPLSPDRFDENLVL